MLFWLFTNAGDSVLFYFTLMFLCRYKDVVECERIVVKAFKTPHEVASFRAAKLSDDFYQMKADFERRKTMTMVKDDITRDPTRDLLGGKCGDGMRSWKGVGGVPIIWIFFVMLNPLMQLELPKNKWCVCISMYNYIISGQFVITF